MKYLKQFDIIVLISFLGEILNEIIPLQIPASIYGFVILFICLLTGIIKLEDIKETGKFLVDIMPIMFIPPAVGLLASWDVVKPIWLSLTIIILVSTILVMAVSGLVTQYVIKVSKKNIK